ncbi:MAG: hypothetical protein V5A36_03990 [Natronomonas sp.]
MGSKTGETTLDEGTIHEVLQNDRRRLVIEALRDENGSAEVRDLAETIAAREAGAEPPPTNKRQSVYVSLHQTHLPKLDSLDIVAYDLDDREVELLDRVEELEVYMEVVPQYGLSWGEFYFGWGVLGLLTVFGVQIGVPMLSEIGLGAVSGGFCIGLMLAAAYHVQSQQDRIVFQRIFE